MKHKHDDANTMMINSIKTICSFSQFEVHVLNMSYYSEFAHTMNGMPNLF